ncbi:hypothetical protein LWI29_002959 [Acer saccharum]|uniref:Uncharacterized protein n=1 Tax=Acer saccharum TaxID=4024 RepID=A0AA39VHG7_ACESA|nr:hypothetical protein LWI29_002959 [Acer saccharum]
MSGSATSSFCEILLVVHGCRFVWECSVSHGYDIVLTVVSRRFLLLVLTRMMDLAVSSGFGLRVKSARMDFDLGVLGAELLEVGDGVGDVGEARWVGENVGEARWVGDELLEVRDGGGDVVEVRWVDGF